MIVTALSIVLTAISPAGLYQSHQTEVGAALELRADGNFRYQLDYGAVSESATGTWTSDGRAITLTSVPMPVAPSYELVRDEPLSKGKFGARVVDQDSPYFDPLDLALVRSDGAGEVIGIGSDEIIDIPADASLTVVPLVPVLGSEGGRFALSPDRGHRLILKFHPNDLGTARFDHEMLGIDGSALLLKRYDLTIRFEKAKR